MDFFPRLGSLLSRSFLLRINHSQNIAYVGEINATAMQRIECFVRRFVILAMKGGRNAAA